MSKTRILVVEDEPRVRANIATILKMEGFDVFEAAHGREGVARARQHRPDLIFCDIAMPQLDGHGVLAALREDAMTAKIPFIFLTARGSKFDQRAGMNLGADDYLVKPVDAADLLGAIQSRLRRHGQIAAPKAPPAEPRPEMLQDLGLTPREAETLFWVAQGKTNPELCVLLEVRLTTIKKHLESIFLKLGVENRTTAAAVALERLNAG